MGRSKKHNVTCRNAAFIELDYDALMETGEIRHVGDPIFAVEGITTVPRGQFEITYMTALLDIYEHLGNKKIRIIEFILANKDFQNAINITQRELAKETGCSLQTVNSTMKFLVEAGYMTRKGSVYRLSPKVCVKGNAQKEGYIMQKFIAEQNAMKQS